MRKIFSGIGSFLQTPVGVILTTNVIWNIVVWAAKIPFSYIVSGIVLALDIFAAFYLRDKLIYFFSQFVLPIQNPKHRREIAARVSNFESGSRGPALFVKNGRVILHEGEAGKRGAGVILLDTASALVLRTDTEIKDTVGPGIKFTSGNEYIAGSVDLRSQWQFIGPLASDQPFLNPASGPSKASNERRQQTSGMTRDGFEISPTISIKFSIKRPVEKKPSESGVTSQYGYDEEAVRNAITREVIQLGTTDNTKVRMEWNKLPSHLVVNIWREYIRKFKLSELFTSTGISGLQTIEDMINKRVKQSDVVALDDTGIPTGEWLESLEFKQLESRGLEIMEVRIHNVLFEQEIENQIISQWSTEWMNLAKKEENQLKEKEALIETASRDEASKSFAKIASRQFSGKPTLPQQNPFKTLQLLIQPLKEYILFESSANTDMEKELRKLDDIWKWLLDNNPDAPRNQQGGGQP
ncbi:MAG: hypothetical protein IPO36_15680 [Anaerolineales bacterium]|jgi:hypothetical protein|uniref:hypothetical protein n=1 Tax=Candidatus Villigracilis affinis TaxID=3140682 RepID=UPI001D917BFE|nr:hypothetical protein [Anaerolineales bacterium]MBK9603257.1 hypothetical protein [Anaerolineales bacterium]MBL0346414.1 hypothetical protein [Anaerolineales bacterium]